MSEDDSDSDFGSENSSSLQNPRSRKKRREHSEFYKRAVRTFGSHEPTIFGPPNIDPQLATDGVGEGDVRPAVNSDGVFDEIDPGTLRRSYAATPRLPLAEGTPGEFSQGFSRAQAMQKNRKSLGRKP